MIGIADIQTAVQQSFDPRDWFLTVLKHGGWSESLDGTIRSVRIGDYHVQIVPRTRSSYYEIKIVDLNKYRYAADERIEVAASSTVLKNTVTYVLSKTTLLSHSDS